MKNNERKSKTKRKSILWGIISENVYLSIAVLFIVDVEVDNHQSDMSRSVPVRSLLKTKDRPAIWPENTAIESAIFDQLITYGAVSLSNFFG